MRLRSPSGGLLELTLRGAELVIVENGETTRRRFVSQDQARRQLEALIVENRARGFLEVGEEAMPIERWPSPHDLDDLEVASDERAQRGDVRGELAALQIRGERDHRPELYATSRTLIVDHLDELFGTLAPHVHVSVWEQPTHRDETKPMQLEFMTGYVRRIMLEATPALSLTRIYAELRSNPLTQYLDSLIVGTTIDAASRATSFDYAELAAAAQRYGAFATLSHCVLGNNYSRAAWRFNLSAVGELFALFPELEFVSLRGHSLRLRVLPAKLEHFGFTGIATASMLSMIGSATHLRRLSLRHVGRSPPPLTQALEAARSHSGLKELALSGFSALGAELADFAWLERIERVALDGNELPADLVTALQARLPKSALARQARPCDVDEAALRRERRRE